MANTHVVSFSPHFALISLIFLLPAPICLSVPATPHQLRPSRTSPFPCHPLSRHVAPLSLPLRHISLSLTPATVLRRPSRGRKADPNQREFSGDPRCPVLRRPKPLQDSPATPNGNTASISVFFFFFFFFWVYFVLIEKCLIA
jgi:hypothetical protein